MKARPTKTVQWNAADYAANSVVQLAWARELLGRLSLRGEENILDVGCGDGKISAEISHAVPGGVVTGIDASRQMIVFARNAFQNIANLKFRVMDARAIRFSTRFDVLFSNAALHWVDDHEAFLRGAGRVLKPGGRLLVSCGGKGNAHDVFLALRSEMRLARWGKFFRKMEAPYFFHSPSDYEKWLPRFGFKPARIELAPKVATYEGRDGFAAWLRTTWLPYTQRVPDTLREEFISAVTERYLAKHPPDAQGRVHIRMVRLEIDAIRN